MATRPEINRVASIERVRRSVAEFTQLYGLSYLLGRHVDKNFWVSELRRCFAVVNVDNLTDFNYSRCFNYAINEDDLELSVGTKEFKKYLVERGMLNRVQVMISVVGPYVVYKYLRYEHKDGKIILRSDTGPEKAKVRTETAVSTFCKANELFLISDDDLKRTVDGISLELHGPNPTIFNVLFEDGSSGFPY